VAHAIKLRFLFDLTCFNCPLFGRHGSSSITGPRFTRWLPNGRADAIRMPLAHAPNRIEVWFDRLGSVQEGFIVFGDKHEFDENVMRNQLALEAGHLNGEAVFACVLPDELNALKLKLQDTEPYLHLARNVADFLSKPLKQFLDTLRLRYGQFWLPELHLFDSRVHKIAEYCRQFWISWRENETDEWLPFEPSAIRDPVVLRMQAGQERFSQLLTEDDWRELQKTFNPAVELPLALSSLVTALQLLEDGQVREAFIHAVTGLELALDHKLSQAKLNTIRLARRPIETFADTDLTPKFATAATLLGIDPSEVEDALAGIQIRNDIVHEGKEVPEKYEKELNAVFDAATLLLGIHKWKRPNVNIGNAIWPEHVGKGS